MTDRTPSPPARRGPDTERGTALLVTLVMLFLLSVIGASTMRDSTMERRMAENAVQSTTVLQVAESASEFALADTTNLRDAFALNGAALSLEADVGVGVGETTTADAQLSFVGEGVALGYSLGSGSSKFVSLRYESRGEAEIGAVRAYRGVTQGAWRVVPAAR